MRLRQSSQPAFLFVSKVIHSEFEGERVKGHKQFLMNDRGTVCINAHMVVCVLVFTYRWINQYACADACMGLHVLACLLLFLYVVLGRACVREFFLALTFTAAYACDTVCDTELWSLWSLYELKTLIHFCHSIYSPWWPPSIFIIILLLSFIIGLPSSHLSNAVFSSPSYLPRLSGR